MKHARVIHEGREHTGTSHELDGKPDAAVRLDDGRIVPEDQLTWLPPLAPTPRPRTILALGLNYADHAKELEFKAPEEPLVFVKGPEHADRPPPAHLPPGRRAVHALRMRARDRDRQDRAPREA